MKILRSLLSIGLAAAMLLTACAPLAEVPEAPAPTEPAEKPQEPAEPAGRIGKGGIAGHRLGQALRARGCFVNTRSFR